MTNRNYDSPRDVIASEYARVTRQNPTLPAALLLTEHTSPATMWSQSPRTADIESWTWGHAMGSTKDFSWRLRLSSVMSALGLGFGGEGGYVYGVEYLYLYLEKAQAFKKKRKEILEGPLSWEY